MLTRLTRAVRQPEMALRFGQQRWREAKRDFAFHRHYRNVRRPRMPTGVPHDDPRVHQALIEGMKASGLALDSLRVDLDDYRRYLRKAGYGRFPDYGHGTHSTSFPEKSLEHYLAARLLELSAGDVYIDVASSGSPTPEIYADLYGCETYRQDLVYPPGRHGNRIGGNAADMPLRDGFASKMGLHCSFEHFEGDSDTRFIREAGRVLRPGGRLCVVPLYLFDRYAIQTNPVDATRAGGPVFDEDAVLYCERRYEARFGRFYDVPRLVSRVCDNLGDLRLKVYVVENARDVSPSCWVKFVALMEKP